MWKYDHFPMPFYMLYLCYVSSKMPNAPLFIHYDFCDSHLLDDESYWWYFEFRWPRRYTHKQILHLSFCYLRIRILYDIAILHLSDAGNIRQIEAFWTYCVIEESQNPKIKYHLLLYIQWFASKLHSWGNRAVLWTYQRIITTKHSHLLC